MSDDTTTADVEVIVRCGLPNDGDTSALGEIVAFTLTHAAPEMSPWSVAVSLVDDAELQALHRDFMDIDEPTDVMTFPADLEPGAPGNGGDIVISVERAAQQGPEHGKTPWHEIVFCAVHGALHLAGWDDHSPAEREAMHAEQDRLINLYADSR